MVEITLMLKRLVVENNENILFDVKFAHENQKRNTVFSTVIIGVNGTGKSYLLTILAELFRAINNKKTLKNIT